MIVLVDNGSGNHASLANMFRRAGRNDVTITNDGAKIREASGLVLPGVGHFSRGAQGLDELGLREVLTEQVIDRGVPFLGVCVGMQLLAARSEEGGGEGLGWIDGTFERFHFPAGSDLKVPNMGWRQVEPRPVATLFAEVPAPARFYFVHSYRLVGGRAEDVAATSDYGGQFACAIERGNIHGVQFHPERSHRYGMALLRSFAGLCR